MREFYIQTDALIKEEHNDEGETTYFIAGKISKDGKPFEECVLIWDGNAPRAD